MKIHHFGYITKDIDKVSKVYQSLGFENVGNCIIDNLRKISIQFMSNDESCIELIMPLDESSDFYPLLKKYMNTIYHICYKVENIEETALILRKQGFIQTTKIQPAVAISNHNVAFFLHPVMGIIELLEMTDEGTGISI